MKNKILLLSLLAMISTMLFAQSWQTGSQTLYSNPYSTTKVGIGISSPECRLHVDNGPLKIGKSTSASQRLLNVLLFGDSAKVKIGEWQNNDQLSFQANRFNFVNGNVGIGVTSPQYELDVKGTLFLRTTSSRWNYSFLYWQYHSLVMGTPPGTFSHNTIELKPGGADNQTERLYSRLEFYNTNGIGDHEKTIDLHSGSWCWFNTGGNFGINTSTPQYQLDVNGTIFGTGLLVDGIIKAKEIIVTNTPTADFVFDKSYKLRPLQEVETFVQENKHLPEIPSAKEMEQNGVNLNELTIQLLQKVEELTLYTIEQEKRIKELEEQLNK